MSLVPVSNQAGVLEALGLDPRDAKVQALALVAQRYNLDLLLKHVFLIKGTVYVSHAGLLHLAHVSGDLDGLEVEVHEDDKKWIATAKVYRKSMSRPFVYTDQCLKNETQVPDKRKRAITRAERNALRRAFDVGVEVWEDDRPTADVKLSDFRPELPAGEGPKAAWPGSASRGTPEPSPAGPSLSPGRSVAARCREMGLSGDDRHSLVAFVTDGRTDSSKELTAREASRCHQLLHTLASTGEKPWPASNPQQLPSSSPPGTESPARTGTTSEEPPPGGAA